MAPHNDPSLDWPSLLKGEMSQQVLKWNRGNDIWALVVMTPVSDNSKQQEQYMIQGIPAPV
jgi:hemolysin-activating ACP:hemolysin acyltransferase